MKDYLTVIEEQYANLDIKVKSHTKTYEEIRGKITISNLIIDRPKIANERKRIGDWEADTVLRKASKCCLATLTDRKSRYLLCKKVSKKNSTKVKNAMIELLKDQPLKRITPDRGKIFLNMRKFVRS